MRLRANEICPIHRSVSCCRREIGTKPRLIRPGVQRVEDPHHPRLAAQPRWTVRRLLECDGIGPDICVP
jgi:hypothetical protein